MIRSIALAGLLAAAGAATATPAHAGHLGFADRLDFGKREVVPIRAPTLQATGGFHGDIAAFIELKAGFALGQKIDQFLFDEWNLWRAAVAVRGALGRDDSLAAAALVGYSSISLVGFVVEAGVDARLTGTRNLGPIAQATARLGPIGLSLAGWVHLLEDERDWGWNVGVGWTWGDYD